MHRLCVEVEGVGWLVLMEDGQENAFARLWAVGERLEDARIVSDWAPIPEAIDGVIGVDDAVYDVRDMTCDELARGVVWEALRRSEAMRLGEGG